VTVLEGAKALGKDDPEAAALVLSKLRGEGIEIVEGAKVSNVSGTEGAISRRDRGWAQLRMAPTSWSPWAVR
jgi:NADPH-dependent 2,4-dienoyl-CoA reductase/sulfur reductase-like enzyme